MAKRIKYIFRGTTLGYAGNKAHREHSFTPATKHPFIALLFAMECKASHPENAVVYVAKYEKVKTLEIIPNVLSKYEQEVVLNVLPKAFPGYCEGYVLANDFFDILARQGFRLQEPVNKSNLTRLCRATKKITLKEIDKFTESLQPAMKK